MATRRTRTDGASEVCCATTTSPSPAIRSCSSAPSVPARSNDRSIDRRHDEFPSRSSVSRRGRLTLQLRPLTPTKNSKRPAGNMIITSLLFALFHFIVFGRTFTSQPFICYEKEGFLRRFGPSAPRRIPQWRTDSLFKVRIYSPLKNSKSRRRLREMSR